MRSGKGSLGSAGSGVAGRSGNLKLGQVELAVFAEQQFNLGPVEFDLGQVQGAAPEAVQLQVGIQLSKAQLRLVGLTQVQAPQAQLQAKWIELHALQACRHGAELAQLLVDDAQGDAGEDQKAQQAVEGYGDQHGAQGAFQSFVHGRRIYVGCRWV